MRTLHKPKNSWFHIRILFGTEKNTLPKGIKYINEGYLMGVIRVFNRVWLGI